MPKISQTKRHRRKLDFVAACAASNNLMHQISPRKVSEEKFCANTSPASGDLKSNFLGGEREVNAVDVNKGDQESTIEQLPRLTRRKPSRCLSDLVCSSSSQDEGLWAEGSPNSLPRDMSPVTENLSCISPIWGQFVDMILEQEEQKEFDRACLNQTFSSGVSQRQQQTVDVVRPEEQDLCFPCVDERTGMLVSIAEAQQPRLTKTTRSFSPGYSSSPLRSDPFFHPPMLCDYPSRQCNILDDRSLSCKKKKGRRRILSPHHFLIAEQRQEDSEERTLDSTLFVLQDPASLPDAMARLKV